MISGENCFLQSVLPRSYGGALGVGNMGTKYRALLITQTLLVTLSCSNLKGSQPDEIKVIIERNVPVPMRDGTILRADVHRPDRGGPYPVLVHRTPYGKYGNFNRFVKAGYIVVSQDIRGKGESDGKWQSLRCFETHDAEDGCDTVEWAARLPGSNGKVGTFGTSYPAFLQWRLAPLRPPSLVAMSACGSPARFKEEMSEGVLRPRRLLGALTRHSPEVRRRKDRPGVHTRWEALKLWDEGDSEKWINWLPWFELPWEVFEEETETFKYLMMNPHVDPWRIDVGCKEIIVPI
jgi:predicted acyl esterase